MKLSDLNWNLWVLFLTETNQIVHAVGFEDLPNVATLIEIFNELKNDPEFEIDEDIDALRIDFISKEQYIELMGDFVIDD